MELRIHIAKALSVVRELDLPELSDLVDPHVDPRPDAVHFQPRRLVEQVGEGTLDQGSVGVNIRKRPGDTQLDSGTLTRPPCFLDRRRKRDFLEIQFRRTKGSKVDKAVDECGDLVVKTIR